MHFVQLFCSKPQLLYPKFVCFNNFDKFSTILASIVCYETGDWARRCSPGLSAPSLNFLRRWGTLETKRLARKAVFEDLMRDHQIGL